ncbi:Site-specific recombinase XerD [Bradyrhizobium lablabi]|uniref:Site-specific recombinase XerD n=3 Tax=Nitrobacteraceae TaxID=41294 RepID=A0ABY0QFA4_9BRAD|nr:Site-specific recombinase XerD [Bradyrhizobium ottawaense]SEE50338.1 Site-specific recombinase XerD [Bradyrhizobium lablabi]
MSVYKPKKSPFYQYDFWLGCHRFHGPTKCANRKDAEKFETVERERAAILVKAMKRSAVSLLIDDVADRLWNESAQHDAAPDATETNLARLIDYFGKAKSLTDIDHTEARKMVAWRRGHHVTRRGKLTKEEKDALPLITNSTVNRSATKVLQRLFTFAKTEGAQFEHEPNWTELLLPEPQERVRELHDDEAAAFDAAMRADYEPFFEFVGTSGMRQKECVTLRWSEVNFGTRQIVRIGKGGRRVVFPITDTIRDILFPLQGQHPQFVFTYVAVYGNKRLGRVRGQRYPLTINGTKTAWQTMRAKAGVKDFRFHDYRHDFGTKLLRDSGNLKLVQKAMNHRDIKSTLRYAHVLDEDVASAVEAVAKSRKKSRTTVRKVG